MHMNEGYTAVQSHISFPFASTVAFAPAPAPESLDGIDFF